MILNKGNISSGAGNPNEEWYNWLLDNYGDENKLGKLQNLLNDYKKYIKINPYGNKYKLIGNEECVLCVKNRTSANEPVEEKWMKIPEAGWSKKITDEPYISTEGLPLYESANYLELSTYLSDAENSIGKDLFVGNPVAISYVDVPGSYTGTFDVASVKRIYTYAYVGDGKHIGDSKYCGEKDPNYKYELKYENGKYILPDDFAKYSYNEIWTCDGCEKCSQYSCNMIETCTKSKVQGSYLLSYGSFICTNNENPVAYMNEKTPVYRRRVERYNTDESGNSYKYVTYSYYPSYESIPVSEISVDGKTTLLDILTIGEENGIKYVLDKNQHVVKYDNNDDILASYVYVGRNILCPTQEEYIHEYSPKLPKGYSMSYSIGSQQVIVNPNDGSETYFIGIKEANTYWKVPNRYNIEGKGKYSGWKMMTELPDEYDKSSKFSYYNEVIVKQEYSLSYRYINVRELLSNNTIPQFYDNYEKDYNKFASINIQPDKPIPSEPDKSLTDIYHKEQPDENKNKPSGKLRVRVCELYNTYNGGSYNDTQIKDLLNKEHQLYKVNWSNTTTYEGDIYGLEIEGLEDIYIHCYDKIYDKVYKIDGNEWVYDEKATIAEDKTYQIEPCQPKISIDKYSKLAKYTFTLTETDNGSNVYKLGWNVTEDMLKTFKDKVVEGNIVISNEDQKELTIKLKGTYTPKESVRYTFTVWSTRDDGNVVEDGIKFRYDVDDDSERFYNVTSYYENLVDWQNTSGLKYWVGCTALKYDEDNPDGQRSTYFESILENISDNNTTKRYRVHQTTEAKKVTSNITETWRITPNKQPDGENRYAVIKFVRKSK